MSDIVEQLNPMIHVRFQGQSWRLEASALDIGSLSSDNEVKQALANHFDVPVAKFAAYVVERHDNGNITVRPEAVFG
ncbi:MAG: hypothetical protein M3347_09010 [Armatimonadota bacterium]|nr:hypothetical protein [Armatimonadota bacterium]